MRPRSLALIAVLLLAAGCGSSSSSSSSTSSSSGTNSTASSGTTGATATTPAGAQGPEKIPLEPGSPLAPATATVQGSPVHGIQCGGTEQFVQHIHAHVAVYVNGQPKQIPGGVGLIQPVVVPGSGGTFYTASNCFYWLHTHAADGVVHIESPSATKQYVLGDFFAIWSQQLSSSQVGPASGKVTAFVNGKPWLSDPAKIPLTSHASIQLDVGTPVVPFSAVSFAGSGL